MDNRPNLNATPSEAERLHGLLTDLLAGTEKYDGIYPAINVDYDEDTFNIIFQGWNPTNDGYNQSMGLPKVTVPFVYETGQAGQASNVYIVRSNSFEDTTSIGYDADGNVSGLVEPGSQSSLSLQNIYLSYNVTNPHNGIEVTHRWEVRYTPESGFELNFYKGPADGFEGSYDQYKHEIDHRSLVIQTQILRWIDEQYVKFWSEFDISDGEFLDEEGDEDGTQNF